VQAWRFLATQPGSIEAVLLLERAVRQHLWVNAMQQQIEFTAKSLRESPSAALSAFQKILGRPSYFLALPEGKSWSVLLGPRPKKRIDVIPFPPPDTATVPELAGAAKVYEYIAPPIRLRARLARFCLHSFRGLQQWLMHPVIDSRY
jgi:hypothetical protein